MKKKILALAMAALMLVVAVVGGTLAYFTDEDQNTNEFTVGDLAIDLYEEVSFEDGAGKAKPMGSGEDELTEKTILGKGDDTNPKVEYKDIMPGDKMTKIVTVENKEDYAAYVALAVQHHNYHNFNKFVDTHYEAMTPEQLTALGLSADTTAAMQEITDDIWSGEGWKLSYDKLTNGFDIRYYPTHSTPVDQDGSENYVGETEVKLIAIDYNVMQVDSSSVGYKDNMFGATGYDVYDEATDLSRTWIYYLYLPAKTSYTLDLTTTCPTYVTTENVAAFEMDIDVQATAIQVDGFATAKDAFAELNKTFGYNY